MTKRECKKVAKKIAAFERIVERTTDKDKKTQAQNEIMRICGQITDIEDMIRIDEEVQNILNNNS